MNSEKQRRAEEIFLDLVERPPEQRRALLNARCADDTTIREEVASLLKHHDGAENFLDGVELLKVGADLGIGVGFRREEDAELPPNVSAGGYTIRGVLGSGGMGVVYVAEQQKPRRTVALKVIRRGIASAGMMRRFEHEAEVLGRLQHSGIAQIFEAGAADFGHGEQMFIAMELVNGQPLTHYAESRGLGTRERLELIAKVCDAVQHAHQRGIIHRDLKPGNILVSEEGEPKILDFGVARASDSDLAVTTLQTSVGQLIGTLPYMSPEQVVADPSEVDTRSDVYALGVILFQLLAGRLPHDVSSRSIPEAARVIRDESPARLSSISKVFRGEIETIVAKAMEKNKARRYQSAADLAEDIRRHLRGEPITAKNDSALYVLRKQLKRYRGAVAVAAVFIIGLVCFSIYAARQSHVNADLAAGEERAKRDALASLEAAQRARDALRSELRASTIEQGKLSARLGDYTGAELMLWREFLQDPSSAHARWALWDLYRRNPFLSVLTADSTLVRDVAYSPDGAYLATAGTDRIIRFWDTSTWRLAFELRGHCGTIYSIAFSPDGTLMLACDDAETAIVWDVHARTPLHQLCGHTRRVIAAAFSPDGSTVATGGDDTFICLWNASTGRLITRYRAHGSSVNALAFSPDGLSLASISGDATVRLWNTGESLPRVVLRGHLGPVTAVAFSSDGSMLATGGDDKHVRIWNPRTGEQLTSFEAKNGTVYSVLFAREPGVLYAAGWWSLDRWNTTTWKREASFALSAQASAIDESPTADRIACASAQIVRAWTLHGGTDSLRISDFTGRVAGALHPSGEIVAGGDASGVVRLFSTSDGSCLASLFGHRARIRSIQFSQDGRWLATGAEDGFGMLWDVEKRSLVRAFPDHTDATRASVSVSSDGALFASATGNRRYRIYDVATGEVIQEAELAAATLPGNMQQTLAALFSPEGDRVAVSSRDKQVRVFDLEGNILWRHHFGDSSVWCPAFSADGDLLALTSWAKSITVWNVRSQSESPVVELLGHGSAIWHAVFCPADRNLLASASADGSARLWDLTSGRCIASFEDFDDWEALSVDFSRDGSLFMVSTADHSIHLWRVHQIERRVADHLDWMISRLRPELGELIREKELRQWKDGLISSDRPNASALLDAQTETRSPAGAS